MASLTEKSAQLNSARIEGVIEMTGMNAEETGLSDITILFGTAFDATTGDSSFLMDMSSLADAIDPAELEETEGPFATMALGFFDTIEFRQIGERVFLKMSFFTALLGAETEWISMPAEDGDNFSESFSTVPSDPMAVVEAYEDAAVSLENLGTETVNGVDAIHYRISLNTDEMDLTAEERAELEESGLFAEGIIPMDIWVTEEGYTVRMTLEIDGTGIDAPPAQQFDRMRISYDMLDINQTVVIDEPPAADVTAVEDLEGGFFGLDPES